MDEADERAHPLGLGFEPEVVDDGDPRAGGAAHPSGALLHDVSQLVSEEPLAMGGVGAYCPGAK